MIAKIKVDRFTVAKHYSTAYKALVAFCEAQEIKLPAMKDDNFFDKDVEFITDIDSLVGCGFEFSVKEFLDIAVSKNILGMLKAQPTEVTNNININNDDFLFSVDEVDVLEDCCTDDLRDNLKDGWRILSICGAYKQRRPDYIIGRTKTEAPQ